MTIIWDYGEGPVLIRTIDREYSMRDRQFLNDVAWGGDEQVGGDPGCDSVVLRAGTHGPQDESLDRGTGLGPSRRIVVYPYCGPWS